ncbi:MAG: YHS domain-containing (seleno)protein [Pseudomonadota bacterium]
MLTRRATLGLFAAAPLITLAAPARAAEPPVFSRRGRAIRGADPVAFFTEGAPVDGSRQITHEWNGATWRFASEDNRALFVADPERYAPQFGGYCAFAAARGYVATSVPEAWSIVDDKLYLNFSLAVRDSWTAELPTIIAEGEANWPAILG